MKRLFRVHRYLSCFVAPAMLFFAITGAWQAFRLQEDKKDGSYVAPGVLKELSEVHMAEHLSATAAPWFRFGELLLAAVFATTAIIGLVMAFRIARPRWIVYACVTGGVVLPVLMAIASHAD